MMKNFYAVLCLVFVALSCQNQSDDSSQLIDYLPKDTPLVMKINKLSLLQSAIKNNDFIQSIEQLTFYKQLSGHLKIIEHFNPKGEVLLCVNEIGKQNFEYVMITKHQEQQRSAVALELKKVDTIKYDGAIIKKIRIADYDVPLFTTVINDVSIVSSSRLLTENSIRQHSASEVTIDTTFHKLYKTSDSRKSATIFINHNTIEGLSDFFLKENTSEHVLDFADWTAIEVLVSPNSIAYTGIAMTKPSSLKTMNSFAKTVAQKNTTALVTPNKATGFISFTFDDYEQLRINLLKHNKAITINNTTENDTIFKWVNEVGVIFNEKDKNVVMHTPTIEYIKEVLQNDDAFVSEFREIAIYEHPNPKFITTHFSPLIKDAPIKFYAFMDNFIVFSQGMASMQNIITNYLNKATLAHNNAYLDFSAELNDKASILMVGIHPDFKSIVQKNLSETYQKDTLTVTLNDYPYFAFQAIYDRDFMHTAAMIKKINIKDKNNAITQSLSVILDADVAIPPQFVTNHRTKQKELIVQDSEHVLYLISNKGKVLWKKKLKSRIQGKIQQVDIYKNGRLQLAFVTQNTLHIIDRNGNAVAPFPIRFSKTITQPLAVFDYDNNKNYRFLVCSGKGLSMYNRRGEIVSGFTFTQAQSKIQSQPQHYRMGGKDYLVIPEERGKLNILHRTGKMRIPVNETIDFSENTAYLYADTFMVTDKAGNRIQIDQKGTISRTPLNLEQNHYIKATPKLLISLSDNVLTIHDKKILLDFGFYTRPEVFYIGTTLYVAITDTQTNKVYLYDRNGVLLPNFPIYGMSSIAMDDIDNDKKIEITVQGDKNAILLYEINN